MERISAAIARAKKTRGFGDKVSGNHPIEEKPRPKSVSAVSSNLRYTQTPVVPVDRAHLIANKIFAFDQNDVRSSRFDMLRTQLLQTMEAEGLQTLGITSPSSSCGKTVVAINLALSIARQFNHTVMLVDFDLRKPAISKYLGLKRRDGIGQVLDQTLGIEDIIVSPGFDRLTLLPNFERIHGSSEKLASGLIKNLVIELKNRYSDRIIIFDLPPILEIDDAVAFLPLLDCSVLVAAEGSTSISQLEECASIISSSRNLGVIYNKSTTKDSSYTNYSNYAY